MVLLDNVLARFEGTLSHEEIMNKNFNVASLKTTSAVKSNTNKLKVKRKPTKKQLSNGIKFNFGTNESIEAESGPKSSQIISHRLEYLKTILSEYLSRALVELNTICKQKGNSSVAKCVSSLSDDIIEALEMCELVLKKDIANHISELVS